MHFRARAIYKMHVFEWTMDSNEPADLGNPSLTKNVQKRRIRPHLAPEPRVQGIWTMRATHIYVRRSSGCQDIMGKFRLGQEFVWMHAFLSVCNF